MNKETNYPQSAVLENADLLRVIGGYLIDVQLPFVLSFKAVREALKPLNHVSGEIWIISKKKYFVTSVSMVEWSQSLGCEFILKRDHNNLFTYAASNGSVDVLRWTHQQYRHYSYSAGVSEYVCYGAAINGHIEVLEYLRSLGNIVVWPRYVGLYAARGGHLHAVKWLREVLDPPCPWENDCYYAAVKGHLHILKWLRAQDPPCPWNSSVFTDAAFNGHLKVLQWLRAQDPPCPWSESTCEYAASAGHLHVLRWLRSQEPPCPWWKQDCIDRARIFNQHEIVEWILSQPE